MDKIKRNFFQAVVVSILLYRSTTWTLNKRMEKELESKLYKNAMSHIKHILEATFHNTAAIRSPTSHL